MVAYLSVTLAKYCGLAFKHLTAFIHWVAMPAYAENQFAKDAMVKCQLP
jgi:hypothetical protein